MGYDFWLEIDTGGTEPAIVCEPEHGNYTYNVSGMFNHALAGEPSDVLDGHVAADVLPLLHTGVARMEEDPAAYQALNPPNGWGDYEGALRVLRAVRDACAEHPKATLRFH